jgi:hypothetical protein
MFNTFQIEQRIQPLFDHFLLLKPQSFAFQASKRPRRANAHFECPSPKGGGNTRFLGKL